MKDFLRFSLVPLAMLLASAAPAPTMIPHPEYPNYVLVIPHNSPVKFRGWHEHGYAQFDGQFVLTGAFALRMTENCDGVGEACLVVDLEPDPAITARLPRWNNGGDFSIEVRGEKRLVQAIANSGQRSALVTGKMRRVSGRIAVVVDNFSTSIECEGDYYWARFVKIAKTPKLARSGFTGGVGCAA